jgi:hypothetical protein
MVKPPKRPRDPSQLAKLVIDIATGQTSDPEPKTVSPMGELGRAGGLKGGRARAAALSPERRREIAKSAASRRWSAKPK